MNAKPLPAHARRQIERLKLLLEAERERSEKAWDGYRQALYENVDLKMRLDAVQKAMDGEAE